MRVWRVGLGAAIAALWFGMAGAQMAGSPVAPKVTVPPAPPKILPPAMGAPAAPAGGGTQAMGKAGGAPEQPAPPAVAPPASVAPPPGSPPAGEPFLQKPAALGDMEAMLNGLGYPAAEAADRQSFSINWTGKYNYVVQFSLSADQTLCYAFVMLATYTPGQMARLPMLRLLEQDDAGDFFYSAERNADGGETLYGNSVIPLSGLTAGLLHGLLASMTGKMDAGDAGWNAMLWN